MPASQGEHLISHYADMMSDTAWPASFHGEQIGVATLTMARLQEQMLAGPAPRLRASAPTRAELLSRFGPERGSDCWADFAKKRLTRATAEAMTQRAHARWPEIRERIGAIARPARELEAALRRASAPVTAAALGWPPGFYQQAVRHAREIRNRWTFLDLAVDADALGEPEMMAPA
jgi:glycerol-1-phosphate dehydrogenase [NAD(P)+]